MPAGVTSRVGWSTSSATERSAIRSGSSRRGGLAARCAICGQGSRGWSSGLRACQCYARGTRSATRRGQQQRLLPVTLLVLLNADAKPVPFVLPDARPGDAWERLAAEIAAVRRDEPGVPRRSVVLVSSGAIALGVAKLGLKARPKDIALLQAAAAAGQNASSGTHTQSTSASGTSRRTLGTRNPNSVILKSSSASDVISVHGVSRVLFKNIGSTTRLPCASAWFRNRGAARRPAPRTCGTGSPAPARGPRAPCRPRGR